MIDLTGRDPTTAPTREQERQDERDAELWARYVKPAIGPLADIRAGQALFDARMGEEFGSRVNDALDEVIGIICSELEDGGMPWSKIDEARALLEGWSSLAAKRKAEKEQAT
jgi:hypothetical protein